MFVLIVLISEVFGVRLTETGGFAFFFKAGKLFMLV